MKSASLIAEIKNAARSLTHSSRPDISIQEDLEKSWAEELVWKLNIQSTHLALPSLYVYLEA